jgi:squalene synthase HpnC
MNLAEAQRHCRRIALGHYENFPVLSWCLPRRLHQPFCDVYAFCRIADDLADESGTPDEALRRLADWRRELDACFAGCPRHPALVALRETIVRFDLPREPFEDLLSAFEQDQRTTHYETYDALVDYCRRSANPVGRLVLQLGGAAGEQERALSDDVCTGLQLINFWQDLARDADKGRTYLPRKDRLRFGYGDEELAARRTTPAFLDLMAFEVERAQRLLQSERQLAKRLPAAIRRPVRLFAWGGLRLCEKIRQAGYRVWERRVTLSKWDFLKLAAGAVWR